MQRLPRARRASVSRSSAVTDVVGARSPTRNLRKFTVWLSVYLLRFKARASVGKVTRLGRAPDARASLCLGCAGRAFRRAPSPVPFPPMREDVERLDEHVSDGD